MAGDFMPTLAMILVQVGFAGLNIFSKLAMDTGMNPFVMVAYRQIFATITTAPVALLWERKMIATINKKVLFQLFQCSIFGATMNQCLYFLGLKYTNPTIACALNNLLPALTFILAIPFRMETVGIKKMAGQAKVIGTILCVGGAMLMTFYKGELIHMWISSVHWRYAETLEGQVADNGENMLLGSLMIVLSCVAWAAWFIIQAKMSESFSAPYSSCSIMSFIASIECVIIGASVERDVSGWALGWNIRFYAVAYAGIVVSGISFSVMNWCIQKRGPLFVSMFSPLLLVIVAVVGWGILDEKIYEGSAVGSALIVGGLYAVLWGKGKEQKDMEMELQDGGRSDIILPVWTKMVDSQGNEIAPRHTIDCSKFDPPK